MDVQIKVGKELFLETFGKITKRFLSEWGHSQYEQWNKVRKHGAFHYVLVRFVIWWGGVMAAGMSALTFYVLPAVAEMLWTHFVIWPLLFLYLGVSRWSSNETKYRVYSLKNRPISGSAAQNRRAAT